MIGLGGQGKLRWTRYAGINVVIETVWTMFVVWMLAVSIVEVGSVPVGWWPRVGEIIMPAFWSMVTWWSARDLHYEYGIVTTERRLRQDAKRFQMEIEALDEPGALERALAKLQLHDDQCKDDGMGDDD